MEIAKIAAELVREPDIYVRDLIWHGRNQSQHYEDFHKEDARKRYKQTVEFIEGKLNLSLTKNQAKTILDILEWKTFEDIKRDMIQLKKISVD